MKSVLYIMLILGVVSTRVVAAEDCTPSRWGPDDEIGAANLVTPERVAAGCPVCCVWDESERSGDGGLTGTPLSSLAVPLVASFDSAVSAC